MKTINLAAGVMAILMTSGAALAQAPNATPPAPAQQQVQSQAQAPATGISEADFLNEAEARFKRLDTNGDGSVSAEERRAGRPGRGEGFGGPDGRPGPQMAKRGPAGAGPDGESRRGGDRMERLDANDDGTITVEDFVARAEEHFARIDTDGDGTLSADEMPQRGKGPGRMGENRHGEMGKGRHGGGHARMQGHGGKDGPRNARMERNGGAELGQEEFMRQAQERFESMDTDGDGTVTAEERQASQGERGHGRMLRRWH